MELINPLFSPLAVDDHARRFYKHWYTSKKKAFTRYAKKFADAPQEIDAELGRIKQYAQVVRVIAHTQVRSAPSRDGNTRMWV